MLLFRCFKFELYSIVKMGVAREIGVVERVTRKARNLKRVTREIPYEQDYKNKKTKTKKKTQRHIKSHHSEQSINLLSK